MRKSRTNGEMEKWKNDLKVLADQLRADQKNKKGFQSKFDKVVGYKNKKGFNDTGIPLTARAAKNLRKNKASYRGRYIGTTLQQINEERKADAKERWKDLRAGPRQSADTGRNRTKDFSVSQMIWRNSATSRVDRKDGFSGKSIFQGYGYSDPLPEESPVTVNYILPYEKKEPEYKPKVTIDHNGNMKFKNKIDESIYNIKRGKR